MQVQHFMYFTRLCTLFTFWVYTPLLYQNLTFCTKLHHSNRGRHQFSRRKQILVTHYFWLVLTTKINTVAVSHALLLLCIVKRLRGRTVSAPDFESRGRGFESRWRRYSSQSQTELHCTEPFMFTLPSSRNDWNTIERDVKPHIIHPLCIEAHLIASCFAT